MKKFTRIEPTDIYEVGGLFKRTVTVKHYRTDDGMEHEFSTWHAEGGHNVAVIPLTPDGKVVTAYQFRSGPEQWLHELPGGTAEPGEDIEAAARRELFEETGCTARRLVHLGTHYRDAYTNETDHYFIGYDCAFSRSMHHPDETERNQGLETRLISIDDLFYNATHAGMTDSGAVLMAYDYLKEVQHETAKSH
ncbi:NUDIX hydrolase [Candidatus Saccharibacteria bacterium]|nr:NUDIX hydrolase [Candidatus Saccharibacteria bacterium]